MATQQEITLRQETEKSLIRLQQFDANHLVREELGKDLNFQEVLPAAERLLRLYNQIPITVLEDLPQDKLTILQNQANADFNRLEEIQKFSARQNDAYNVRNNLIQQIEKAYQGTFNQLHPIISYSTSKVADFKRLETEARSMIQKVEDHANALNNQLEGYKADAEQILEGIRNRAAEEGVSQQASYFRDDAAEHERQAKDWGKWILISACILGVYAMSTVFLHKIPWIKPDDVYQTVQLAISKVLIFGVLSYMVYLATKNYLAHKHNAVINKHRQNALMTYTAIVDAAKDTSNKEVILTHASACIFAPQPTGYNDAGSQDGPAAKSVVELLTNTMAGEK
jgi:hypothetical protein